MKVLVNCYACSPYQGSEPGMGWNFVSNLSRMHELHILTECKFKEDIDKYFEGHPEEKAFYHFYFIKRTRWNLLRKIWPPSYYWTYAAWQRKALAFAKELEAKEHFDLIHQLNMVGYRECGYLWQMGKPMIWGPMGNFNITPWRMLPVMGLYGIVFYTCRNLINLWQMHFSSRVKKAVNACDAIICAMEDDKKAVKKLFGKDSIVIPEVGLAKQSSTSVNILKRTENEKLRICWSGLHISRKALPLLLKAIAQCEQRNNIELHILGDGPFNKQWKQMAQSLNLSSIVWHGQVSRDEAMDIMKQSHVFAITSLSDATSTVLLEALSIGLPIVALNHLGFAGVITPQCGIKIDIIEPKQVISDIAKAVDHIATDEAYRQGLANGALSRAQDFRWDMKAEMIDKIYHDVVASSKK